ncbi:NAD-dependent epimerase/dehydratase family protein [Pseudonocardiaceae bacterium YIM PH 21723]|nr:NAD-dependent epimerase/dehydratase family protein [Pseudonocardiaceae bacterium YIM PH 21723]
MNMTLTFYIMDRLSQAGFYEGMTRILVTGATGKTGTHVTRQLRAKGIEVLEANRSRGFDWSDESTWDTFLSDVDVAYIAHPDITVPEAEDDLRRFGKAAVARGVRRLVLLSARPEIKGEQAITTSEAEWTIVGPGWFNENFTLAGFAEAVRRGRLALPLGDVTEPFVAAADIAAVAVAALTEDGHRGRKYKLTGPRALSFAEAAAAITAAGRPVTYVPLSPGEFIEEFTADGGSRADAEHHITIAAMSMGGEFTAVSPDVEQVLGRPAIDFADWAKAQDWS